MPGGIRLERKKSSTLLNTLKRPYTVKKIRVSLIRGEKILAVPAVKNGEEIEAGKKIAFPGGEQGSPLFSGIAGKTKLIEQTKNGSVVCTHVEVTASNDFRQTAFALPEPRKDTEGLSHQELRGIFREMGLLTTDEREEPLHKILDDGLLPVKTIVINGCEPEPYVTAEQVLMMNFPTEVLRGAEILRKAAGAEKVIFVIEDAERELFELIKSKIYLLKWDRFEARKVPAIYPMGMSRFLPGDLSINSAILNGSTAYAAYEAVYLHKPFFERVVTVGGECVVEPRNLWLPLGISIQDALQLCKGLLREPARLIIGGPMKGVAQRDGQAAVTAGTNAVLALPKELARESTEEPCIRCNRCVDACPVFLSPVMITLAAEKNSFEVSREWNVEECIECGLCSFVCPSKRPMLELIAKAKEGITGS